MALTYVRARGNWQVQGGLFSSKASFICGSCQKLVQKVKCIRLHDSAVSAQDLCAAQCAWCGTLNAFFDSAGRPLVRTDS